MTIHILKTDADPWRDVEAGRKPFEVRKDDRDPRYESGDVVVLVNSSPGPGFDHELVRRIGYVYRGAHVPNGFCVFELESAQNTDRFAVTVIREWKVSK